MVMPDFHRGRGVNVNHDPARRLPSLPIPNPTRSERAAQRVELSVVIPVYDEQDNIFPLLVEILQALRDLQYEVIYVNDGSTDRTLERLLSLKPDFPRLRVLHLASRCGQSMAIRVGVQAARAPWIATLDGDGQNDPADIRRLIKQRDAVVDTRLGLLTGWRQRRRDTWVRRVSSRIANTVRACVLGDNTPDTGCGLKLFPREVFLDLPYFDHMHRFLPALVQRAGWQVVSVPVSHRPRKWGNSKYGINDRLWVGIVDLFGVVWLRRRAKGALNLMR